MTTTLTNAELLDAYIKAHDVYNGHPTDAKWEAMCDARDAVLTRMVMPAAWTYRGTLWSAELEAAAEKVYSGFSHLPGYVPWTRGGNSDKQNEARDFVRRTVAPTTPAPALESGARP